MIGKEKNINKLFKEILYREVLIVLPLLLLGNLLINLGYNYEVKRYKASVFNEISKESRAFEGSVQILFQDIFQDLLVVENANEFNDFLKSEDIRSRDELEKMFQRYMDNKEGYLQLRFLDEKGVEEIRVERSKGNTRLISKDKLQDKGNRYYFRNAKKIEEEGIYISNLDLNIEFNKIVEPYLPVIRFSKPIRDENGRFKGVLVINYDGRKFLKIFNNYFKSERSFLNILLLDNKGYYLSNKDSFKNFGFMFEGKRRKDTIKYTNPSIWKKIVESSEEIYEENGDIYYFTKIMPKFRRDIYFDGETYYWITLVSISKDNIPKMFPGVFLFKRNIKLYMLFGIFVLTTILIILIHLKKRESTHLYLTRLILNHVDDAVIITDFHGVVIDQNEAFEKLTGYSKGEISNLNNNIFKYEKKGPKVYGDLQKKLLFEGEWKGELWLKRKDNTEYPASVTINNIKKQRSNQLEYKLIIIKDLSKEKEREKQIEYLMTHNIKSNLPNEEMLNKFIKREIKRGEKFSIVYIKLEKYSDLQIKYPEKVLNLISKGIIKKINDQSGEIILAQLSTEVFIAILKTSIDRLSLNRTLSELSLRLKNGFNLDGRKIPLEFSIGGVIFPEHGKSSKELMKKAIYSIKAFKLNKERDYYIYQDTLEKKVKRELDMEESLITAIEKDEFQVYFQPQVDSRRNKIIGLEALIRWDSERLGWVSPVEFIPLAEKLGIINNITMWMVGESARLANKLELYKVDGLKISINLSSEDFKNVYLVEDIMYQIDTYNLNSNLFEMELTEGVMVDNYEEAKAKIDEFYGNGISIALDDFGTGFSSLSYLKELKFNKVKIDRSFIKDYPTSDNGRIAKFITDLSKQLEVQVIAEGVETKEQMEFLQEIGCDNIQGYYYSKPLPAREVKDYIEKFNTKIV